MLTEKELEAAINRILGRIDEVNRRYIKKIAAQLLKIGELNASSVNRLIVMTDMNADPLRSWVLSHAGQMGHSREMDMSPSLKR